MRFFTTVAAVLAVASGAIAAEAELKKYIVSFPKGTPDSAVNEAKDNIIDAGGKITHEFKLINGFSAEAPEDAFTSVSAWATDKYQATFEEDQTVTIMGSS